ncbi:hypothetical protein CHS0354_038323 [Potamilus streckersoni]|uniref:Uncharacterized protein n=1 Tax=Potamilus streckersoni TaxID=2493646 RepID=A0AAE0S7B5_9BIVA|nr:hypothetical protein CHS0354_038323 [Potamilus streckersoni]
MAATLANRISKWTEIHTMAATLWQIGYPSGQKFTQWLQHCCKWDIQVDRNSNNDSNSGKWDIQVDKNSHNVCNSLANGISKWTEIHTMSATLLQMGYPSGLKFTQWLQLWCKRDIQVDRNSHNGCNTGKWDIQVDRNSHNGCNTGANVISKCTEIHTIAATLAKRISKWTEIHTMAATLVQMWYQSGQKFTQWLQLCAKWDIQVDRNSHNGCNSGAYKISKWTEIHTMAVTLVQM